mmetsp:Transcript_584/g.1841  ORF Transcript_584/g.1841 Transcript_584/m.1841 type:complete len:595 (+) Transcript_584:310-2094(+)
MALAGFGRLLVPDPRRLRRRLPQVLLEFLDAVQGLLQVLQPQRVDQGREHVEVVEEEPFEVQHVVLRGGEAVHELLLRGRGLALEEGLQARNEVLLGDLVQGGLAFALVAGAAGEPQELLAEGPVVSDHAVLDPAGDQQEVREEGRLAGVAPHRGEDVDAELLPAVLQPAPLLRRQPAPLLLRQVPGEVLHHDLDEGPVKRRAPAEADRHDGVQELRGLPAAEPQIPHLLGVTERLRRAPVRVGRQRRGLLQGLGAPVHVGAPGGRPLGQRALEEATLLHHGGVRQALAVLGPRLRRGARTLARRARLRTERRRRGAVPREPRQHGGLRRGRRYTVGRQDGPRLGQDVLQQLLRRLGLLDGAALRVEEAAAVRPRGPRRQGPGGVPLGGLAGDAPVALHDLLVVLPRLRQLRLQARGLLLLLAEHLLQGLVDLHGDHLLYLPARVRQLLLGRHEAVLPLLQLPLHVHFLRGVSLLVLFQLVETLFLARQVFKDFHVDLVSILSRNLVPVRRLCQSLLLRPQDRAFLDQDVPLAFDLEQPLLQTGNLHLVGRHGLAHVGEALGFERLQPPLQGCHVVQVALKLVDESVVLPLQRK